MMKKLYVFLLMISICLVFVGCGNKVKEQNSENIIETIYEEVETQNSDDTNPKEESEKTALCGDANSDGKVDNTDVNLIVEYMADNTVKIDKTNADVFKDDKIDEMDSMLLSDYLVGILNIELPHTCGSYTKSYKSEDDKLHTVLMDCKCGKLNTISIVKSHEKENNQCIQCGYKEKVEEIDISSVDNYATTMEWKTLYLTGLTTEYPADWQVKEYRDFYHGEEDNGKIAAEVTGVARGIDEKSNKIIESNVKIIYYMPDMNDENDLSEFIDYIAEKENKTVTSPVKNQEGKYHLAGYISKQDEETENFWGIVEFDNNDSIDETFHFSPFWDGQGGVGYRVTVIEEKDDDITNYKVVNIKNRIFGGIKTTSF